MILKHKDASAHWYTLTGEPRHEADLRQARSENLLPSVTTILKSWSAPHLENYKVRQAIEAALRLPRRPGEEFDEYAQRILEASYEHAEQSATLGIRIHEELNRWAGARIANFSPELEQFCLPVVDFINANTMRILHSEIRLANADYGIAGTTDLVSIDQNYGTIIWDFKCTKVRFKKGTTEKQPRFWPSYMQQLAAYAKLWQAQEQLPEPPRIGSLVIDTEQPGCYAKVWEVEEQARGWQFMQHLVAAWQVVSKYKPHSQ